MGKLLPILGIDTLTKRQINKIISELVSNIKTNNSVSDQIDQKDEKLINSILNELSKIEKDRN